MNRSGSGSRAGRELARDGLLVDFVGLRSRRGDRVGDLAHRDVTMSWRPPYGSARPPSSRDSSRSSRPSAPARRAPRGGSRSRVAQRQHADVALHQALGLGNEVAMKQAHQEAHFGATAAPSSHSKRRTGVRYGMPSSRAVSTTARTESLPRRWPSWRDKPAPAAPSARCRPSRSRRDAAAASDRERGWGNSFSGSEIATAGSDFTEDRAPLEHACRADQTSIISASLAASTLSIFSMNSVV